MITVEVDEQRYAAVANGMVKRVVENLIQQFINFGILEPPKELTQEQLDLIFSTAFGVFAQFEDMHGHELGTHRHPAVVGFLSIPINTDQTVETGETILTSPRRTDLHGGITDEIIRSAYAQSKRLGAQPDTP